jgi:uncharacterized membrane protein
MTPNARKALVLGFNLGEFALASLLLALIEWLPGNSVKFFDRWLWNVIAVFWLLGAIRLMIEWANVSVKEAITEG